MYSRRGIPKDSLKLNDVTRSLWSANQRSVLWSDNQLSVLSLGHAPCRLHKPHDSSCPFHSDSHQQKDNTNSIQPPHSTTCFIRKLPSRHCQPHAVLHVLSYAYNKLPTCSFRWPHSTSTGYSRKLASKGSILRNTLHSQDGLNLGDICFCPRQCTLNMQCISLDYLQKLVTEGAFMPSVVEGTLKLSETTAILLVLQVDDQCDKITDVYIGLVVRHIESHLYAPEKILDFVSDIEVDLKAACDALKARGDLGKRHAFCLSVNNRGGIMSIPMDLSYCLVYPTSYVKDVEPDHFDTHNNPAGTCLRQCICHATLQYMNDDPCYCRAYGGSHLILPRSTQYKERLFAEILEPQNHQAPLTDPITKEPFPMELMGDFRSTDPIFKGCYGDSFLYSDVDPGRLR